EWQGVPKVEPPEVDLVAKGEVDRQREPERQYHKTEVRVLGLNRQEISHVTPHLALWAVRKPHILGNATLCDTPISCSYNGESGRAPTPHKNPHRLSYSVPPPASVRCRTYATEPLPLADHLQRGLGERRARVGQGFDA